MFRRKFLSIVLLVGLLIGQSVPQALAATYCDSCTICIGCKCSRWLIFRARSDIYKDLAVDEQRHVRMDHIIQPCVCWW